MEKAKKKTGKLQVEIDLITVVIFAVILVFSSLSYYNETKDVYLDSKKEMFDRDLKNLSEQIETPWFWRYTKEYAADMTRDLTAEEKAFFESKEAGEAATAFLEGRRSDYETCGSELQFLLGKASFQLLAVNTDYYVRKFNYTDISFMEFPREGEAYLYLLCNADEPDPLNASTLDEYYMTSAYAECFRTIPYSASEHPAVKEILAGGAGEEKTAYELWRDPADGRYYYIGYKPVAYDGAVSCYARIRYDCTEFFSHLTGKIVETVLWGLGILVVLNGVLLLMIHRRATKPLAKVTDSVRTYMEDKDSRKVNEAMSGIRVSNEIGVLADNFSALATEMDRYTGEILRLGKEKERIATELSLATNIQNDAIPSTFPAFPDRKEFDIHASMDPAKEVGGDFYDFFMIDEDHLAMVIADVSGKGVPAALFMMSSKILINDHASLGGTPAEILERVNRQVFAGNKAHMFVSVWLGILEISTGKLITANAGHEFPMIRANGQYEMLKDKHGLVIGAMKKSRYTNTEIQLKKGDSIFVYTDGVAEATDAQDQLFGTDRTLEALNAISGDATQKEILAGVRKAVDAFVQDAPQFDDLTMLGLKYFGPDGNAEEEK